MTTATNLVHPFEKSLGAGPYKFVGCHTIIKPCDAMPEGNYKQIHLPSRFVRGNGTCAHCGHAIMNVFLVEIGNGEVYGVGCDCIEKVGLPPQEMKKVEKAAADRIKALAKIRKVNKVESAKEEMIELFKTSSDAMQNLPHPSFQGKSLLDYAVWVHNNVSNPANCLKTIKKALKG